MSLFVINSKAAAGLAVELPASMVQRMRALWPYTVIILIGLAVWFAMGHPLHYFK